MAIFAAKQLMKGKLAVNILAYLVAGGLVTLLVSVGSKEDVWVGRIAGCATIGWSHESPIPVADA